MHYVTYFAFFFLPIAITWMNGNFSQTVDKYSQECAFHLGGTWRVPWRNTCPWQPRHCGQPNKDRGEPWHWERSRSKGDKWLPNGVEAIKNTKPRKKGNSTKGGALDSFIMCWRVKHNWGERAFKTVTFWREKKLKKSTEMIPFADSDVNLHTRCRLSCPLESNLSSFCPTGLLSTLDWKISIKGITRWSG